jgi:hypothetical protein
LYVPTSPYGVKTQKISINIFTAVRTSNLMQRKAYCVTDSILSLQITCRYESLCVWNSKHKPRQTVLWEQHPCLGESLWNSKIGETTRKYDLWYSNCSLGKAEYEVDVNIETLFLFRDYWRPGNFNFYVNIVGNLVTIDKNTVEFLCLK